MSLGSHLRELRRRLVLAAIGIFLGAIAGWFISDLVYDAIKQPIEMLQEERNINALLTFPDITSALDIKVRISALVGLLVSSPWWMYQLWAFINPGLTKKEKRYALSFVGAGVPLFLGGAAMAWIALPNTIGLLTQFIPEGETAAGFFTVDVYLRFVINFILVFGFSFLLPLVMVALTFLGVVRGVTWLRGWRWAVIMIFVLAALATPTGDPITFILMAIPIIILYFMAVGVCFLRDRSRDKKRAAEGPGDDPDDPDGSPPAPPSPAPADAPEPGPDSTGPDATGPDATHQPLISPDPPATAPLSSADGEPMAEQDKPAVTTPVGAQSEAAPEQHAPAEAGSEQRAPVEAAADTDEDAGEVPTAPADHDHATSAPEQSSDSVHVPSARGPAPS